MPSVQKELDASMAKLPISRQAFLADTSDLLSFAKYAPHEAYVFEDFVDSFQVCA